MKRMNRAGGEKILSIWWFIVLAIAGVAIVVGVAVFYSAEVDTREIESAILYERVVDCVNKNGFAEHGFFDGTSDFYNECGLNKSMFVGESDFFFEVSLTDISDKIVGNFTGGAASFKADCEITKKVTAKHFPKCMEGVEQIMYRIDGQSYNGKLVIYTGSNQHGARAGGLQFGV